MNYSGMVRELTELHGSRYQITKKTGISEYMLARMAKNGKGCSVETLQTLMKMDKSSRRIVLHYLDGKDDGNG